MFEDHRGRLLGRLMATSSVAALLIGGATTPVYAGCVAASAGFNNSGTISCVSANNTSFNGTITNSGTINPGGISLTNATIAGTISNSGNIAAVGVPGISIDGSSKLNSLRTAVYVNSSTFTGGISNAGTISAGDGGIFVGFINSVSTFAGGITNNGTISASSGVTVEADEFSGGISNGGNIAGTIGIRTTFISTFSGGLSNSGSISTRWSAIGISTVSNFTGGITNSGSLITGRTAGILLWDISTFVGGISNSGTISAANYTAAAINFFDNVSVFSGGIANSGRISSAGSGILVYASTFLGGITNNGTISAGGAALAIGRSGVSRIISTSGGVIITILVGNSGGITNSGSIGTVNGGIIVNPSFFSPTVTTSTHHSGIIAANSGSSTPVETFSGGIANSGSITGATGIYIANASFLGGIANSGTIIGTSGTAIDISGALNAITIDEAGGTIAGKILFSPNGDTLTGDGALIGDLTTGNATIAPTLAGTGVIRVTGNYTQGASGKLVIEVSPANASKLAISGRASLGGTIQFVYDPGTYTDKVYQVVTASGGVTGTFGTISGTAPGSQSVSYAPNEVDLALSGVVAPSGNTGVFGSAGGVLSGDDFAGDDVVFAHLDEQQFGEGADSVKTALAGTAPMQLAFNGDLAQLGPVSAQLPGVIAQDGGWVRGMGNFFSAHGQGAAPGYSSSGGGLLAGLDRHWFNRLTLGIAGGYSRNDLSQKDGTSGTIDTPRVMLYARYEATPQIVVDGVAGFAYDRIHTSRPVAALGANATESHNAYEENFALQAGYIVPWRGFTIIPRLGVQYAHLSEGGFSETGASGFDMSAPKNKIDSFQPIFSVSALDSFVTDSGIRFIPEMKLAYSRELLSTNRDLVLTTASGSLAPTQSLSPAHDTVTVGPEITAEMNRRLTLYADYSLAIGIGKSLDHTIFAGMRWAF